MFQVCMSFWISHIVIIGSMLHVQGSDMHKLVTKPHTIVEAYFDLSSVTLYLILV